MTSKSSLSCVFVIFGGTGDLTHRKLIPAVYNLAYQDNLPESFSIVAVGRRDKTDEEYRNEVYTSVKKYNRFDFIESKWDEIKARIYYRKVEFSEDEGYDKLKTFLDELDGRYNTSGNRVYYLAVAPDYFDVITQRLHSHGMAENVSSWQRVVIEKPFGKDLESARYLNKKITAVFSERNIYRIDHYLGKEMIQSITGIRFANSLFEPLWNSKFIDNIQISSSETIGVENRGEYYEKAGALGDMVQNHMLQLLALIAMEPPSGTDADSIRDEKVKLLSCIDEFTAENIAQNIVLGQYSAGKIEQVEVASYRQENRVDPESNTETYAALRLFVRNSRWDSMPIYIRTGKRLAVKSTEVVVQFKPVSGNVFSNQKDKLEPNLLVIRIQPKEEVFVQFNTKEPGIKGKICPVRMNFCQNCKVCKAEIISPEAYEKLIYDVMNGDSTLFTRWDEVEQSWKLTDTIARLKNLINTGFPNYNPGSWGPEAADELLARDNRKWWNV